jgi:hypothetical protein
MAKVDELKALAADLRKRLRQVDQLTGRSSERDRDARRKRDVRATAKESVLDAATGSFHVHDMGVFSPRHSSRALVPSGGDCAGLKGAPRHLVIRREPCSAHAFANHVGKDT